ncbi:MAG: cytochrome c maturation protein CcmE [Schleiferiaceae bacterium]|jgi:cytochrome c-type biogenesis protein CcmE
MKRSHIIALVVLALLVGALMVTIQDASTYATFELAQKKSPESVTVVGQLDLDAPITFNAETSMLRFTAVDKDGARNVVYFNQPKPTDFERSEEITLTGRASGDTAFLAHDILMKCPSKYADEAKLSAE